MQSGRLLAGRYRLDAPIGRGGMGEVWRATDERLHRTVAIKVLPAHGAPEEAVARFRREAEIAAGLQHPGIATVFDIDTDDGDGTLFLVMELLRGTDLAALTEKHPDGLPVDRAAALLAQIADALAEAHDNGVVHRDIKPSNVMVLPGDRIKILDFGIARYAEQTSDLTGSAVIGTPAFMAPEQFNRSAPVDHRTDLYALGGVAYQLLTGRRPFTADTMPQLIHDVMPTPAPAVSETRPDVPEHLGALVASLLAKDPADRPSDARDVAARLRIPTAPSPPPTLQATRPAKPGAARRARPGSTRPATAEATSPAGGEKPPPPIVQVWRATGRRGRTVLVVTNTVVGCFILFCIIQVAVLANPGGVFVDSGGFSSAPTCAELLPKGFIDSDGDSDTAGDDRADCRWERSTEDDGPRVYVDLRSHGTDGWTTAPEVARKAMADERDLDGEKDVSGPVRPEPTLGPDAFSYHQATDYRDEYTIVFRRDNLLAKVSYSQYRPRLGAAELRKRALELTTDLAAKIEATR